ncbi:MAG TPA: hypothetical protein DCQ14_05880 [Firmicutes bacterium]|nr:hypothetical protein [Bacillota bacterium]
MRIRVKLYATFRLNYKNNYNVEKGLPLALPEGSTIHDVLEMLQIKPEKVSLLRINEISTRDFYTTVTDNDVIDIFPFVGGG